jgi:hypothetical protein
LGEEFVFKKRLRDRVPRGSDQVVVDDQARLNPGSLKRVGICVDDGESQSKEPFHDRDGIDIPSLRGDSAGTMDSVRPRIGMR